MVITPFQMYLIMKLDSVDKLICAIVFIMFVALGVFLAFMSMNYDYSKKEGSAYWNYWKKWFIALAVFIPFLSTINALLPSTKDMVIIFAGSAIINNQDVQALPGELVQLARKEIQEMLKPIESK